MPVAGFVSDSSTSIDKWINDGLKRLHWKLINAMGEDYSLSEGTVVLVPGTTDYAAAGILRLYGVEADINGQRRTLKPFPRNERNAYRNLQQYTSAWPLPRYRLIKGGTSVAANDTALRFLPANVACTVYYQYAPELTTLSSGSDAVNVPGGWEEYAVLHAAIQCLIKEESDPTELRRELARLESELEVLKEQRDTSMPQQTVDMDLVDFYTGY